MKKIIRCMISFILIMVMSIAMVIPAYTVDSSETETKAMMLKKLGLFKGVSDTEFDLNREPTRTEALVMLIRVLGKESEALSGNWKHPFFDVAPWADKYVGYAYENGLTKGISLTEFGAGNADSNMYLTFVLRAIGYNDSVGDFSWNNPDELSTSIGILSESVDRVNFFRKDVVLVSWDALKSNLKDGSQTLADKLIDNGIFSNDDYITLSKGEIEKKTKLVSISSFEELKVTLNDTSVTDITINSIGNPINVIGDLTIPSNVTLKIDCGNDFYIEGTLINEGTINVMGANAIVSDDFINYSVIAVQNGGKIINNGLIRLCSATLTDINDNGPIGGQLRINGGVFENKGSFYLDAGKVNTHGGVSHLIDGTMINDGNIIADGFFIRIENGSFINNNGATVTNNSLIFTEKSGMFTNNGIVLGNPISN